MAFAKALRICSNTFDAEDAAQEASIKAWLKSHTLEDRSKFCPWFVTISRREALRIVKRRVAHVELAEENERHINPAADAGFLYNSADREILLEEMKQAVSEREWQVLRDRLAYGLRYKEIAAEHSISVTTVKRVLKTANVKLNGLLSK